MPPRVYICRRCAEGPNAVEIFGLVGENTLAPILDVHYELADNGIVGSGGQFFELQPEGLATALERVVLSGGRLSLSGWAADYDAALPAETLVVFVEGRGCVFSGPLNRVPGRPSRSGRVVADATGRLQVRARP